MLKAHQGPKQEKKTKRRFGSFQDMKKMHAKRLVKVCHWKMDSSKWK